MIRVGPEILNNGANFSKISGVGGGLVVVVVILFQKGRAKTSSRSVGTRYLLFVYWGEKSL